jgi:UDP-N-acetylglucosamine 2-epimerase (hydrolysing)
MGRHRFVKKILFLTGTRADFGKLKPLISGVADDPSLDYLVVATGMHLDERYGRTVDEIYLSGFHNVQSFSNTGTDDAMDLTLARTILELSKIVTDYEPDLLVVHGDRVESLAGAIVGALNNVLVAHIEGGELSGTVDEALRHAITKLSHVHFVANGSARNLLRQMGEDPSTIYVIGSPEVDIMLSNQLPTLSEVKTRYSIQFDSFAILIYHPVTTELVRLPSDIAAVVDAVLQTDENYLVLFPNNDSGSRTILDEFRRLERNHRFRILPSMRFEYFQTALKAATFILGNSSSGVREAPVHGTPAVNVGSRQHRRSESPLIINSLPEPSAVVSGIQQALQIPRTPSAAFGNGSSTLQFLEVLKSPGIWSTHLQKSIQVIGVDEHGHE